MRPFLEFLRNHQVFPFQGEKTIDKNRADCKARLKVVKSTDRSSIGWNGVGDNLVKQKQLIATLDKWRFSHF